MKNFLTVLLLGGLLHLCASNAGAQNHVQTIRGQVRDIDTQTPLIGATVVLQTGTDPIGTVTDLEGKFRFESVPVGRFDLSVNYLGYEPLLLNSLLLTSGKEMVLSLDLVESAIAMEEVVVTARHDKTEALNELASVSARSFSVEETSRYAGSFYDPARMAQNYAGVSVGSGDDLNNEIIIRGNSPTGLLWRLEGIEIPNPNHFGALGNSGGGISMLSSSMLTNSDFYTGAFPAEFGNATSGVFDLNLRKGNNEQREHAVMLGVLGLEVATEGPISREAGSSYLLNYRYSTLAILQSLGLNPAGDALPKYQDLSFNINLPTAKFGTFSLFGLGGSNQSYFEPIPDRQQWEFEDDKWGFLEEQQVGTVGLSHRILLSDRSFLRTVLVASSNRYLDREYWLNDTLDYTRHLDEETTSTNNSIRISSTYNLKLNARNSFRAGLIGSHLSFDFVYDEDDGEGLHRYFDNSGQTQFMQAFAHWKHRFNDRLNMNAGLHYSHLMLSHQQALEPRFALEWQLSSRQKVSAALGMHSKMEHLALYLFDGTLPSGRRHVPARDTEFSKAWHAILAYDHRLGENLRLKTELYYQHLFDVPVENNMASLGSLINATDVWDVIGAQEVVNEGIGRNYGVDVTLERFFADQYYFLLTGSLYQSEYQPLNGNWYSTAFNGNYQLVALGGKEFKVGKKKVNILGFNAKLIYSGGRRSTPIDLEASRDQGHTVYRQDQPYAARNWPYKRLDVGISYRINAQKMSHALLLDIQNVTNYLNIYSQYYSSSAQEIRSVYQTGLLPVFAYRVEF
ncbi:TonB-dependent receptor [Flavilitoribacter nigricans]|uniref:TonB-dependent receptor n=1 Tax=Flavilitoribacter nigricans (strain ATCC 23147 / DSM 23189 / NBRC 102662 / NCIMB 1420 / SS-2) TaxID=1122177 RepID=A0A2D0NBQ1_FLAN2|nr:TonB-dependent receptor [Flavilitoribacter nigricans]PHN05790.1 TonB-dependent receptor [Flavilitoribacter nigricans DSM 23189 = NBRC 102662]